MQSAALGILLLLVHTARQESGYSPDDDDEIEGEFKVDFDCFSNVTIGKLVCYLTNTNARVSGRINLTACIYSDTDCKEMERKRDVYCRTSISVLQTFNVCLNALEKQMCKQYEVKKIVKPDPPFNVSVTHDKREKEYSITFTAYNEGEYLHNQLVYQIALRKEDDEWPDCDLLTDSKQCKNFTNTDSQISETDLEPATKYELKVRSKPKGLYFSGRWSEWSMSQTFERQPMSQETDGNVILLWILITVGFVTALTAIILISVFWKSRIKPLVWPEIPDHKGTLEKLCKTPKKDQHMSFHPDIFKDIHINKVDYIKAKPPSEDQVPDEVVQQSETRENASTCIINAIPEKKNGEHSSSENQEAQNGMPADHVTDDATKSNSALTDPVIPTKVTNQPCGSYCNPPNSTTPLLLDSSVESSPIYSNAAKQVTNGCREEAYITMSAFKTPINGIKQISSSVSM
ncbi:interleukin-7 receptor subunit alpha [Discoglossus pictus]